MKTGKVLVLCECVSGLEEHLCVSSVSDSADSVLFELEERRGVDRLQDGHLVTTASLTLSFK